MRGRSPTFKDIPLNIVGSTIFGRYPKISVEQTYNMIISDNFLVPYAGHERVDQILNFSEGRAIYTSNRYGHMFIVIGDGLYSIASNLSVQFIGALDTSEGDVFIDENNTNQIAICDKTNIYIYNYQTAVFQKASIDFIPGYISFQNGRFLAAAFETADQVWQWRLSDVGNGLSWPNDSFHVGLLQTKPDKVVAVQRFPGRGNLVYVFGETVTEPWQDIGGNLFPYQRNSSVNVDYGCLNPATIAYNESIIVWLAANEKSGPVIAFSTGGDINRISTDGIDFKFTQLTNPENSYGFLFRQDGHLIYQITFPDDNLTYIYDFNTKKFFTLCDKNMDAHIAKRIAFFNNSYYFVSFTDGNLYQIGTQFTTYNGDEIPRIRVCRNIRMPDASRFGVNNLTFTIEQGTQYNSLDPIDSYEIPQRVGLSVSKNGGESFGTIWTKDLNPPGKYRNRLIYWNLGAANDFVPQFRFWGLGRFVATDGLVSIYQ